MTDLIVKQAYLTGFVNPTGLIPAFFEPVFVRVPNGNEYYLQECDEFDKIVGFIPGVEDDENVIRVNPQRRKRLGQEAVYAFCPGPDEESVLADERIPLAEQLGPGISHYSDLPGLFLEMIEFCGFTDKLSQARLQAYRRIEDWISPKTARAWRDTQVFLPLIRSAVRSALLKKIPNRSINSGFPFPLVKLNRSDSSVLSVQIPNIIHNFMRLHPEKDGNIFGDQVRRALDDFEIRQIRITTVSRYDRLIRKYIDDGDANHDITPEVIDNALAQRIIEDSDESFSLGSDSNIRGFGERLGKMLSSNNILRPAIQIFAERGLSSDLRSKVEKRLNEWLSAQIKKPLESLVLLANYKEPLTPHARRVVNALVSSAGVLQRRSVAADVMLIDQQERAELRSFGVRFGAFHIYLPLLLKPTPRKLAAQLYAIRAKMADVNLLDKLQRLISTGRTTIPMEHGISPNLYRAIGYAPFAHYAMRVDILERMADMIRIALSWNEESKGEKPPCAVDGKHFTLANAMTSTAGLNSVRLGEILSSLGYRRVVQMRTRERDVATDPTDDERERQARNELWTPARAEDRRVLMESQPDRTLRALHRRR